MIGGVACIFDTGPVRFPSCRLSSPGFSQDRLSAVVEIRYSCGPTLWAVELQPRHSLSSRRYQLGCHR